MQYVIDGNGWKIPYRRGWEDEASQFSQSCWSVSVNHEEHYRKWRPNSKISVKNAIKALQPSFSNVEWEKTMLCDHFLLCFAIILWLVCWKKMNTLDKLLNWGLVQTNSCIEWQVYGRSCALILCLPILSKGMESEC